MKSFKFNSLLSASPSNRSSNCSVLLSNEISRSIVFASGKQLVEWDCTHLNRYPPLKLFKAHLADITVLKKLDTLSSTLISGDSNGNVLITSPLPDGWKVLARFTGHKRSIACLTSIRLPSNNQVPSPDAVENYLILAGASDGSLISWSISINSSSGLIQQINTLQTIQIANQIVLDAALAFLPNQLTHLVLALAVTDGKIAIYSLDFPSLQFSLCFRLPGHTDWVRCLDFTIDPQQTNNLLLVSGSQDHFIRIWRCERQLVTKASENSSEQSSFPTSTTNDPFQSLDELTQTLQEQGQLTLASAVPHQNENRQTVEMKRYPIKNTSWSFISDALLYGHEGWVTNVHWCINPTGSLQLLSTSSDRSMIMWRPSEEFDNVWLNVERFGELATSTNLGLFGAHYFTSPHESSETVLASGWTRAWHRWSKINHDVVWHSRIAPTAHYGPVTDLSWEKEGDYLASCSTDQTTRLWGSWRKFEENNQSESSIQLQNPSWHEICRPQVHGHDLFGVSFIGDQRSQFVSISEEKVIRVFDMTQDFVNSVQELGIIQSLFIDDINHSRPERAIVPALGLSNRVEDLSDSNQNPKQQLVDHQTCPPFEDQLLSRTLWPEIEKIYGHPSELSTITSSHCGKIIASACQANSAQTASIRLHHSYGNFSLIQPGGVLEAHQLTVTRLVFNADDSKLLSVSRDRSWTVWKRNGDGFEKAQHMEKAHSRVIWDACWAPPSPESNENFFITGSRDKCVKTWVQSPDSESPFDPIQSQDKPNWTLSGLIKCDQPIKSCTISPHFWNQNQMVLAIGLEDGVLGLYTSKQAEGWQHLTNINPTVIYHQGPINRISFHPKKIDRDGTDNCRLATGGEDGVVKIFDLIFE